MATVQAALAADGPLTRSELRERVAAAGVGAEGQAMVHILALASIRGLIARGPVAGRDQAFVLARDWLGTPPAAMTAWRRSVNWPGDILPGMPRQRTATCPVGGHRASRCPARPGPVRRDPASGRPGRAAGQPAARGCRAAAATAAGRVRSAAARWASRDPIVGPHRRIVTAGGLFRPFALAGGRAVATWNIAGGQVVLAPFAPLDTQTQAALAADAADVMRFLGQ